MNQVALVGNLTDDPELRYTQSGAALAGFTLAVSHRRWVPSSVDPSGRATSTAKAEEQNQNGSSRTASQPQDRRRLDEKHNGEWQDVNDGFFRCTAWRSVAENAAHTLK